MEYIFDEVNTVDKYEYKLKTEQMLELMEEGSYRKAAEIADTIDWKRVRNAAMLTNVSDIYEKNREYEKSYEVLNLAYRRAEGSRKIISRLCTLALKTGNVDEAIDYYDDFMQVAPKDPNQYILRYQILRAQRAPIEQQIEALEEYKKSEYIEEWAYELAKLYQEAGMTAECLEECDDLILWFSEGQYVYKAMELKMQYKPLTPSQQEKYDRRYEKLSSETEEMPDIVTYGEKKAEGSKETEETSDVLALGESGENSSRVTGEEDQSAYRSETGETDRSGDGSGTQEKKKIGDTMPLDEALRKLLHPEKEEEPELQDLQEDIGEIEAVADMDIVSQIMDEKKKSVLPSGEMTEITPDTLPVDTGAEDAEELEEIRENMDEGAANVTEEAAPVSAAEESAADEDKDDDQITGQMSLEDILTGWEGEPEKEEDIMEEVEPKEEAIIEDATEPEAAAEAADSEIAVAEENEDSDNKAAEKETEDSRSVEKKAAEPILPPDIQRMIDEIEGVIPPEEEHPVPTVKSDKKKIEEPHENMGKVTEELRIDDILEDEDEFLDEEDEEEFFDEEEELEDDDSELFGEGEELEEDDSELLDEGEELEEDDSELFDEGEELEEDDSELFDEGEELEEDDSEFFDEEDEEFFEEEEDLEEDDTDEAEPEGAVSDLDEEFRVNPDHARPDDREIPDDDDDDMDILSATTPLSRKETAKMIATGKTAPLPLDEISDALSMSDTGFIVHGRYELETQSGIGTRAGLTEEQKKLFSYFVPVRGMSEQLVDVLEQDKNCTNREGTSRSGNLLIIGNKGNGKTVLAVDVVKAIQKQRNIRQGKVAIVTGDSLNKKKMSDIFDKLYGGALIIEKAGKMNEKTVARLNKAMEKDTGELLIVLEEQRKPLDRLLSSNREFRRKFTSRLEIPIFINDELVTFGQTYAQENGYRIDEMGILALYSRIDSLQREDHAVTVAEVKEIMDGAIQHSQKASAKKLVKRVLRKNTDDADRILLSEKDFNI